MKTILIEGDFTTEQALDWKSRLHDLAQAENAVTIDTRTTTDADLVAVNTLVTTYKLLTDKNGQMTIQLKRNGELHHLLSLTKFDSILPLEFVS